MIETLVFCGNGNYAAFEGHEQVDREQGSAWLEVLQDKLDRKIIGPKTKVRMPGWYNPDHEDEIWTVEELIKLGRLVLTK